jgi:positive regulator of sigma E activity
MSHDSMCDEQFDSSGYVARARGQQESPARETGTVIAVEDGIARVELPRNSACAHCGMCMGGRTSDTMVLNACALPDTAVGDHVIIAVNRPMRTRAQIWLFAIPLVLFLGVALATNKGLGLGDGMSFLLAILALGGAFALTWVLDRHYGWSAGPVAEIVETVAPGDGSFC